MKKILGGLVALLAVISIGSTGGSSSKQVVPPTAPVDTSSISGPQTKAAKTEAITPVADPVTQSNQSSTADRTELSNNNSYTNSVGNEVHSPAYSTDDSIPAGASAQCRDGTYSFSRSRSGTCSHHGGVSRWL